MAVGVDITDRRVATEALRDSEARYRTTINALNDYIHVVGPDLKLTLFNNAFADWCRGLGLGPPAIGQDIFDLFPFLPDTVRDEYRRVFETGEPFLSEDRHVVADREILTECRKTPVLENGTVVRVITVLRDVTSHRRARARAGRKRGALSQPHRDGRRICSSGPTWTTASPT